MVWAVAILFLLFVLAGLAANFVIRQVFKRIDNSDARIIRLEGMEDKRHGFDKAMDDDKKVRLRCKPDPNCKRCHGRGSIGRNAVTGLWVPCVCCC